MFQMNLKNNLYFRRGFIFFKFRSYGLQSNYNLDNEINVGNV